MITKADWLAILGDLTAEDREKLGTPPTAEELLAFERGELSPEETERIRRLLVAYPALAHAVAQPFPGEDERLPDEEMDRRWAELRGRIREPRKPGRVLVFWRALAAGLAIALVGVAWQAHRERAMPFVVGDAQILEPDGRRGGGPEGVTLSPNGEWTLLTVPIIGSTGYDDYRLDIYAPEAEKPSWRSGALVRRSNDAFAILVPKPFLAAPGTYRIVLFGLRGSSEEQLATYSVRVPRS
jgi:hypothetical protein